MIDEATTIHHDQHLYSWNGWHGNLEPDKSEAAHESLITFVSPGDLSLKLLYMNRLGVCFLKRLQYHFSSLNDHL